MDDDIAAGDSASNYGGGSVVGSSVSTAVSKKIHTAVTQATEKRAQLDFTKMLQEGRQGNVRHQVGLTVAALTKDNVKRDLPEVVLLTEDWSANKSWDFFSHTTRGCLW